MKYLQKLVIAILTIIICLYTTNIFAVTTNLTTYSPVCILMEAKRVLKEDGELIITEWERSTELFKKVLFFPIELMEPQHYKCFMKKDLHGYFASFGLKVVQERHCDYSRVLLLKKV